MLDLSSRHPVLETFHRRFLDDALPSELSSRAFDEFDRGQYDSETLDWGMRAWQARTLDEYRSQVAFVDLLGELTQLGAGFDMVGVAIRVVRDEARHVELRRRMVKALGGNDFIPGEPALINPAKELPPLTRVLQTTVGFLCVGKTLSVRLIAAVRDNTSDPLTKKLSTTLAADESIHGRFGWMLLESLMPVLSDSDRDDVLSMLPGCFASIERGVIAFAGDPAEASNSNPFGYLSGKDRTEVFHDSIRRDILPRFHALGINAEHAWENRHLASP